MAGVGSLLSEKKLDRSLSSHRIAVLAKSLIDSSHGLFGVSRRSEGEKILNDRHKGMSRETPSQCSYMIDDTTTLA